MADNRTGLSPADIAKLFRDRCGDGSVEWVYTPTQTWVLLDAADMLDENDRWRNEFRKMDEWHSKELLAAVDENAKLRELVQSYHSAMLCMLETGIWPTDPEWLEHRMCELGIEVDG